MSVGCRLAIAFLSTALSAPAVAEQSYKPPRNEFGHPDLQGIWTNATITPLERPSQYGDRLRLSEEEAAVLERRRAEAVQQAALPSDLQRDVARAGDGVGTYNEFWFDRGSKVATVNGEKRSSLIVDPKNGRVPPLKPERRAVAGGIPRSARTSEGPEARSLGERCLVFEQSATPPMLSVRYNNNYQIVQTKDTIVIFAEMVHDARIVRLNGKHVPRSIRKWMGDSIGHFEGDTLVVETVHFHEQEDFRGAGPDRKTTERFTRVSADTLVYRVTIEDPLVLERSWTLEYPFHATHELIYEYACHEGNYALPGILAGARAEEKEGK